MAPTSSLNAHSTNIGWCEGPPPITVVTPVKDCAIPSKLARSAHSPRGPNPEFDAKMSFGFHFFTSS